MQLLTEDETCMLPVITTYTCYKIIINAQNGTESKHIDQDKVYEINSGVNQASQLLISFDATGSSNHNTMYHIYLNQVGDVPIESA